MGRLNCHVRAAAGDCEPHSTVICPSLALEPPPGSRQSAPFSFPTRVSCLSSLSKTTQYRQLLRKAFVLKKMSRLAFRLRREMEMALFGTDPISVETAFYSKVVVGGGVVLKPVISRVAAVAGGTGQGQEGLWRQRLPYCFHRGRSKAI